MRRETKRLILWVGRLITLFIYVVFLAYAVIVGIAFVLQLLGANPEADFAEWIYRAAANITEPFRGIFPTTQVTDRSTFNASLLFALIIYLVVAVILHGIVDWMARRIAGIDRAEERERMQAALQAQQDSTRTALGLDAGHGAHDHTDRAGLERACGRRPGGAGATPAAARATPTTRRCPDRRGSSSAASAASCAPSRVTSRRPVGHPGCDRAQGVLHDVGPPFATPGFAGPVGQSSRVTELVERHDGTIDTRHWPAVEQHGRRAVGTGESGAAAEGHGAGDGPADDDHHRGPSGPPPPRGQVRHRATPTS